jgi:hypothetical protein
MHGKKNLTLWLAVLALALPLVFAGVADARYIGDGAVQDGTTGGWTLPSDMVCVVGVHADGTLDIADGVTNSRDCIYLNYGTMNGGTPFDLRGLNQTACLDTDATGSDGAKHSWATSGCFDADGKGISLKDLDRTAAMCAAKGGTWVTSGKCVAHSRQFRGQDPATGAPLPFGTGKGTPAGTADAGFCYATLVTGITPTTSCPSASTDPRVKFGYAVSGSNCNYSFGINGALSAAATKVDGTTTAAGTVVDLSTLSMGECLAGGYSWNNWITKEGTGTAPGGTATIATFDFNKQSAATYEGCTHCHGTAVQYNGPAERWKNGEKTGHKNMLRKVTAGKNWAGPNADGVLEVYTAAASGQTLNFTDATVTGSFGTKPLLYIFGDWMAPAPDGLDTIVDINGYGKYNGGSDYSCAPCHTTGWSNAATPTAGLCSKSSYTTESNCTANGGTWVPMTGVQGVVGKEPTASFPSITFSKAGNWDLDGIVCSRCHGSISPNSTGGTTHQDNVWNSGAAITNLCFGCHQGLAMENNGTGANIDVTVQNVGVRVVSGKADFVNHPLGPQFLNSPHGLFTGTITPNKLGKWDIATSTYASTFKGKGCFQSATSNSPAMTKADGSHISNKAECETLYGAGAWRNEIAGQGSCTTCHDVHNSLFVEGEGHHALRRECQDCHSDSADALGYKAAGVPQVDAAVSHPTGAGTPFDTSLYHNACEVCHMPKPTSSGFPAHLWRIKSDAAYSTFPAAADISGNVKKVANASPDGSYANAVWVDIDLACGQCHGGSSTVTKNGAMYKTKEQLAAQAKFMHNNHAVPRFTWSADSVTSFKVNFDAGTTVCPSEAGCSYAWDFGDSSAGAGVTVSRTYADGTARTVTLTVTANGSAQSDSTSKSVTPTAVNAKPTAAGLTGMTQSAYTVNFTDASTDAETAQTALSVTVNWGDGTISTGPGGSAFSHTYGRAMTYNIIQTVSDGTLFANASVKKSVPVKYSITGDVSGGGSSGSVYLSLLKNGRRVKFTKRTGDGAYSFTNVLPGTYQVRAYKYKYNVVTTTDIVVTSADAAAPAITLTLK